MNDWIILWSNSIVVDVPQFLFESRVDVTSMPCGHTIHSSCLKEMQEHYQWVNLLMCVSFYRLLWSVSEMGTYVNPVGMLVRSAPNRSVICPKFGRNSTRRLLQHHFPNNSKTKRYLLHLHFVRVLFLCEQATYSISVLYYHRLGSSVTTVEELLKHSFMWLLGNAHIANPITLAKPVVNWRL